MTIPTYILTPQPPLLTPYDRDQIQFREEMINRAVIVGVGWLIAICAYFDFFGGV